jgi:hypothetical protein
MAITGLSRWSHVHRDVAPGERIPVPVQPFSGYPATWNQTMSNIADLRELAFTVVLCTGIMGEFRCRRRWSGRIFLIEYIREFRP